MKRLSLLITLILTTCILSAQWEWQYPLPQGNTLYDVVFTDQYNGWAVGENGTIIHTADGGVSWQAQTGGVSTDLSDLCFVDSLNGWAVGTEGTILHTVDGGITWNRQYSGIFYRGLTSVSFVDSETGWVVGGNGIDQFVM